MKQLFAGAIAVKLRDFDLLSNLNKIIKTYGWTLQASTALAERGQP